MSARPLPAETSTGTQVFNLSGFTPQRCPHCRLDRPVTEFLKTWMLADDGYVYLRGSVADGCVSCRPPARPFPIHRDRRGKLRMRIAELRDINGEPLRWRDRYQGGPTGQWLAIKNLGLRMMQDGTIRNQPRRDRTHDVYGQPYATTAAARVR